MKKAIIILLLTIIFFSGCHDFTNEVDPYIGLAAFYKLEGNGVNSAGYSNAIISNGEIVNGHLGDEDVDSAYYLDGEDGTYIQCGSLGKISEENPAMSISLWFKIESGTSLDDDDYLITKSSDIHEKDGYCVDFNYDRPVFRVFLDTSYNMELRIQATDSYMDGEWHLLNITASVSSGVTSTAMYIDKMLIGTAYDDEIPNGSDSTPLIIGASENDNGGMPVSVDNIKIHDSVISYFDIVKMYEDDENGRTTFDGSTLVKSVSSGSNHTLFLKRNGEIWGSGNSYYGSLASSGWSYTPKKITLPSGKTAEAVEAGAQFSLALMSDGTVYGWGHNDVYQLGLGDGMVSDQFTPVQITGLSDIEKIAAGTQAAIALDSDGNVYVWGTLKDIYDNETVFSSPTKINGISNCTDIAAGANFYLMVNSDGTVSSMGLNSDGQLGDGTNDDIFDGITTVKDLTGVEEVAAGYSFSAALKSNGTVWCWGNGLSGQLGSGSEFAGSYSNEPVNAVGISGAVQIAAGGYSMLALLSSGSVKSWGRDEAGELALSSSSVDHNSPESAELPYGALSLGNQNGSIGSSHFAIADSGELMGWGYNGNGQLGTGDTSNVSDEAIEIPYF